MVFLEVTEVQYLTVLTQTQFYPEFCGAVWTCWGY